jgi:hypothetical protein
MWRGRSTIEFFLLFCCLKSCIYMWFKSVSSIVHLRTLPAFSYWPWHIHTIYNIHCEHGHRQELEASCCVDQLVN